MIQFDYRNMLYSPQLKRALSPQQIEDMQGAIQEAHQEIEAQRKADILGFYALPEQDTGHIDSFIRQIDPRFDTMLILGIGGSALGNKALYSALRTERKLPRRVLVYDNVDPVF